MPEQARRGGKKNRKHGRNARRPSGGARQRARTEANIARRVTRAARKSPLYRASGWVISRNNRGDAINAHREMPPAGSATCP